MATKRIIFFLILLILFFSNSVFSRALAVDGRLGLSVFYKVTDVKSFDIAPALGAGIGYKTGPSSFKFEILKQWQKTINDKSSYVPQLKTDSLKAGFCYEYELNSLDFRFSGGISTFRFEELTNEWGWYVSIGSSYVFYKSVEEAKHCIEAVFSYDKLKNVEAFGVTLCYRIKQDI